MLRRLVRSLATYGFFLDCAFFYGKVASLPQPCVEYRRMLHLPSLMHAHLIFESAITSCFSIQN